MRDGRSLCALLAAVGLRRKLEVQASARVADREQLRCHRAQSLGWREEPCSLVRTMRGEGETVSEVDRTSATIVS